MWFPPPPLPLLQIAMSPAINGVLQTRISKTFKFQSILPVFGIKTEHSVAGVGVNDLR